ncbi:MAG: hypothetical protein RIA63_07920 [Cyclobacteriaceae bacterium]
MARCPSGKRSYHSLELAEEALIGAHIAYHYPKGTGPIDVYLCDDCGQYHLTSSGEMNPRLEEMLKEGEIQRQREAVWWEGRVRKK